MILTRSSAKQLPLEDVNRRSRVAVAFCPRLGRSPRGTGRLYHAALTGSTSAVDVTAGKGTLLSSGDINHWREYLKGKGVGERAAIEDYMDILRGITALELGLAQLSDEGLRGKTDELRMRLEQGAQRCDVLVEAFAVVREASKRVLGMRHYDVQILGGIALSYGQITEMQTGEGKTLVAILPAYLFGLEGKGAHVVTVNDYLAQRDAEWVGKVLEFLGFRVGVVTSKTPQGQRHVELDADVTYLTAYELAFMYLQDNSAPPSFPVALSRPLHFAVVDEVDSILIDEARNPFIVNMPGADDEVSKAFWKVAVGVAMELQGPPVPENMTPEELMNYFDGVPMDEFIMSADFIPEPRIKGASLTRRGMAKAVEILVREGYVFLAIHEDGTWNCVSVEGRFATVRKLTAVDNWFGLYENDDKPVDELNVSSGKEVSSVLFAHGLSIVDFEDVPQFVWTLAVPAVLWSSSNAWGRFLNQAVRAVHAFHKDVDYIVRDGEIVVIDTATGRERERSRWQSGLHQAIEAKESLIQDTDEILIRPEDFDQGKITYQVLFSEYATLSGMTGTAVTEAEEFEEAYGLSVVRIPPHKPSNRVDYPPEVYGGKPAWAKAILKVVCNAVKNERPVLVGTMSVEASEEIHRILMNEPMGSVQLSGVDCVALAGALSRIPQMLPQPPSLALDGQGVEKQKMDDAIAFYRELMLDYDNVVEFLRVCASGPGNGAKQQSHNMEDVRYAITVLRAVLSARAWSLRGEIELQSIQECYEVLLEAISSATLSSSHVINLLNARPERSRKEAEIIAQAGVPGTITVATSMAGRGTDILLGGNPKGLVLSTLKYLFGNHLKNSPSANPGDTEEIPLARVHPAFVDKESSMRSHLPSIVYSAYLECDMELSSLVASGEAAALARAERGLGFFELVVEKAELIRSHLRMKMGSNPSLQAFTKAFDQEDWSLAPNSTSMLSQLESEVPHITFKCMLKYALLQWIWFEDQCDTMGEQVRRSGGLCVVVASVPESRRAELQLRGRAGRQGDPGQTHIIASLEDPILNAALLPNQQKEIWRYTEDSGLSDEPLPSLVIDPIIRSVTRNQEQLQQGGRDFSRKYDAVIDTYRRHVYRLRRIISRGSEASRSLLFHDNLRDLAEDLVEEHCGIEKNPRHWNLKGLVDDIIGLLEDFEADEGTRPEIRRAEDVSISMHLIEDSIVALLDIPTENAGGFETQSPLLEIQLRRALLNGKPVLPTLDFQQTAIPLPFVRKNTMRYVQQRRSSSSSGSMSKQAILSSWVGDVLCSMYETKRGVTLDALTCSHLTNEPLNTFQAAAIIRVWERDLALECIDSLWSDFLQDIAILQAASQGRAFSMFDPVDEFRLESATAFSRLLRHYSAIVSSRMLGRVDLQHIRYLEGVEVAAKHAQDKENIDFVLGLR
jgi:preprotein translocase subunit SecA